MEVTAGPIPGPPSRSRVQLWALVLDARSVPCRLEHDAGGGACWCRPATLTGPAKSCGSLRRKTANRPPVAPPAHPLAENTLATLSVLVLLATFHNLTQLDVTLPAFSQPDWVGLGNAQAARILDGQWWRLVTALTLHADTLHLVSNLAIWRHLCRIPLPRARLRGLAWSLLLGGRSPRQPGQCIRATPGHSSVGASTTVFGAVGILAALSLVRYRQQLQRRWPLPVASALALLALLGTEGKTPHLGAHLFGFLFGMCLAPITEYLLGRYGCPGRLLNALLALLSAVVVVAAWWAVNRSSGGDSRGS